MASRNHIHLPRDMENDEDESPASTPRQRPIDYSDDNDDDDEDTGEDDMGAFQPGAIVRVQLTNFITYANAEFFPGPNLNMVIGPNGTGKSSLVCAICLGLGFTPIHLGRAQSLGEFVKHGSSDAFVEIELHRRPSEPRNHTVRVKIGKDNNTRNWFLNGKVTGYKAVQDLVKSFNIQVDNLCQFLPQDKVSEFSNLSPIELLIQTQRAAAPQEMLFQHDKLKKFRKEQKSLEDQQDVDKEQLGALEKRQEISRADVERLEERNQVQEKVALHEKSIPFVEYRDARLQYGEFKERVKGSQRRFRELEAELEPTLQSISRKEEYQRQITVAVRARKAVVDAVERQADDLYKSIGVLDEIITKLTVSVDAEGKSDAARRKELQAIQRKITEYKGKLKEEQVEFNAAEWNERVRAKEHEVRDMRSEIEDFKVLNTDLMGQGKEIRRNIDRATQDLAALNTQEGQQMSKLESVNKEAAKAWKWVQENLDKFEKEVYGPPLITCSIKDPRYTDAIESLLRMNDWVAITAQTDADYTLLSNQLFGVMKLAMFPVRKSDGSGLKEICIISDQQMRQFGFDKRAIDLIDGPEIVLSMLVDSQRLHNAVIALDDINDQQYDAIVNDGKLSSFVAGNSSYKIARRAEYGPLAVSTSTRTITPAKFWIDQPVDVSARDEIQSRINFLQGEFDVMKAKVQPGRIKAKELEAKIANVENEIISIKKEKADKQRAYGQQAALPDKIKHEEESLEEKRKTVFEYRERVKRFHTQHDHAVLRKSSEAFKHKELIAQIRKSHQQLIEAEINLIEAKSDVEGLKERNKHIQEHLENERQQVKQLEVDLKRVKAVARAALDACQAIRADSDWQDHLEHFQNISAETTVELLQREIEIESSKLQFMPISNRNAVQDFKRRQVEVDKLKEKIVEAELRLEGMGSEISAIRDDWEPKLDEIIGHISEAFSHNFEQIGCAGEVGIHKDDDFEKWSIEIKVKFRENEDFQILDAHRQSGGERSVSTIFYLMSLQSLAQAPFRVVDEINQGMDPRNERMVHERMVEIACKKHTSQYFLITPKLLTGLRYDKRMKVLCIASGEHMPENHTKLDVSKIISVRRAIMAV